MGHRWKWVGLGPPRPTRSYATGLSPTLGARWLWSHKVLHCCTRHIVLEFVVFSEAIWACCWWQGCRPVFIRVHLLLSHSHESISAFVCALWTYCFCRIQCVESKAGQRLQELQKAKDTQSYFHTCTYTWLPHSRTTPTHSLTLDNIHYFRWSDNFGCQVCHKYRVMKRKQMFGGETVWSVPVWSTYRLDVSQRRKRCDVTLLTRRRTTGVF